jgi:hypothetical protein
MRDTIITYPPRERAFFLERTLFPEEFCVIVRTERFKPRRNTKTSASLGNMVWKIRTQSTCSPTVLGIHRETLIIWLLCYLVRRIFQVYR